MRYALIFNKLERGEEGNKIFVFIKIIFKRFW
jgi:hypothetical protein